MNTNKKMIIDHTVDDIRYECYSIPLPMVKKMVDGGVFEEN
jgi:hypothetical protein